MEFLFIVYALNALYGCPCAYRTCGIKHYSFDGQIIDWEATNLDCGYVEEYLSLQTDRRSGEYILEDNASLWYQDE